MAQRALAGHTTIPEAAKAEMSGCRKSVTNKAGGVAAALVPCLLLCLVPCLAGQRAAQAQAPPADQDKPANQQKPPANPPSQSNPFPEDTNNVPVLPSNNAPAVPVPDMAPAPSLPSDDADPVRSPDDPAPGAPSSSEWSDSSSAVPMDRIQPPPDEETRKNRKRGDQPEPAVPQETPKEDESVGSLYLDQHNWKGALSRYESAVVLDPDNPNVYWGLAEAQRHLGQFAAAKANYEKVMEYDPGSKHAKDADKLLKEPDLAKAAAAPEK